MRLLWAHFFEGIGGAYGYSYHARMMRRALEAEGVEITTDPEADVDFAVHIVLPTRFAPIKGKRNLLFTMTEATLLPAMEARAISEADLLVVPSTFCEPIFRACFPGPVEVCQEGIDPAAFPFYQRRLPRRGEPFRFLWVGSIGNRKGFDLACLVWNYWLRLGRMPRNAQLYLKTSGTDLEEVRPYKVMDIRNAAAPPFDPAIGPYDYRNGGPYFEEARKMPAKYPSLPGMILDTRNLPGAELLKLYQSAHVFLMPTRGEAVIPAELFFADRQSRVVWGGDGTAFV